VMLNFWSQSGRYSQKTFRRRRKPLFSLTPKQNCRFLNFYLFIYLFIFQLRFTWRGKKKDLFITFGSRGHLFDGKYLTFF
jgi:hypothetical protein